MRNRHILILMAASGWLSSVSLAVASPQMPQSLSQFAEADGTDDNISPVVPAQPKGRDAVAKPADSKPSTRAESLDALFGRLSKTMDADEATGIATLIQHIWMESGSDTADLLMARAMSAMEQSQQAVAMALLDKIVTLRPDWAEAWNKRATLRFLDNDDEGSMEDISRALTLEPRHFGALSGLGFILKRNGLDKAALKALRRAKEIFPESPDIRKAINELVPDVEGRDL